MKFLKIIFLILIAFFSSVHLVGAELGNSTIKDGLIGTSVSETGPVTPGATIGSDGILDITAGSGLGLLDVVFTFVKDSISGLLMLVSLGVFLFIGIRLGIARGNPEEFKKALMHFVYAVVGIFMVSVAWAIVKLVAGLNVG